MTENKKQQLQERLAALHDKYCTQLPSKYSEIKDSWDQYQTDFSNVEYIDTFYRLIHTLKGTAATFGFVTQADICFEIQKLLLMVKEEHSILDADSVSLINTQLAKLKAKINTPAINISD